HIVFFFSSRRRHTRSKRDWSSDVCSSDLVLLRADLADLVAHVHGQAERAGIGDLAVAAASGVLADRLAREIIGGELLEHKIIHEIGRASSRERVEISAICATETSRARAHT